MEGENDLSSFSFNSDIELDHKVSSNGPRRRFNLQLTITPEYCNMINIALAHEREKENRLMDNTVPQPVLEKCRASNFSASSLTIGTWQVISQREGDLVGKFYYNKKKIVWEILNGDRKSKIEIPFSNIIAIKATIQDNEPGELKIELEDPPDFAVEAPPQPRKHTIWQLDAPDFTHGQAMLCRRHVVKCRPGALEKHYNLLLQSDSRLLELSRRPFSTDEYPVFSMIAEMSSQCYSFAGSPFDPLVKLSYARSNGLFQQQPNGSEESNAPQISVTGFNPKSENFVTGALNWNLVGNIQEHNISLPQEGVVSLPSTVTQSPELFAANTQSWAQTCQDNIGMTNLEFSDDMSSEAAPPIMVSPTSIVAPFPEHFETNIPPLLEQSWLKTCQDNIEMNTLELIDDMSNEIEPPIMVSIPSIVEPSSEHFETNIHPLLEESWLKTCQDNIETNTLELVDYMSNEVTPSTRAMYCPEENSSNPVH